MSIVGIAKERRGSREAEETRDGKIRYRRTYLVITDNKLDDENVVLGAVGLPQKFEAFPTDLNAHVVRRNPRQISSANLHWEVAIEYEPPENPDKEGEENVTLWEPVIALTFETFQVPAVGVREPPEGNEIKKALENSAGEAFDPPALVDESRTVLTVTRNEVNFKSQNAIDFVNTVNSSPIVIGGLALEERQARLMGIAMSGRKWQDLGDVVLLYYPVQYVIHIKEETWDVQLLDQGSYHKTIDRGVERLVPFTNDGQPFIGLLDGFGFDLIPSNPKPQFLRFRVYRESDFSALSLPETI